MRAILRFLREHAIYALILLLVASVIGVESVRPGRVAPLWVSNTVLLAGPPAITAGGHGATGSGGRQRNGPIGGAA
jgi:hypothetical protein